MPVEMTETVEQLNVPALVEFDAELRVRKKLVQSETIVAELLCYEPGQIAKQHVHPDQDEIFYCLEGIGTITFADREDLPVGPGSLVYVPAGVRHGLVTSDDSRLVVLFTKGPGLPKPRSKRH